MAKIASSSGLSLAPTYTFNPASSPLKIYHKKTFADVSKEAGIQVDVHCLIVYDSGKLKQPI